MLKPGTKVLFNREPHLVTRVNDCCAVLQPLAKVVRRYVPATGKNAGKAVQFATTREPFRVAPMSNLEVVS